MNAERSSEDYSSNTKSHLNWQGQAPFPQVYANLYTEPISNSKYPNIINCSYNLTIAIQMGKISLTGRLNI